MHRPRLIGVFLPDLLEGLSFHPDGRLRAHPGTDAIELKVFHRLLVTFASVLDEDLGAFLEVVDDDVGLSASSPDPDNRRVESVRLEGHGAS